MAARLDDLDYRIMRELQRDGRTTFQRLSEIVGLSPRPCLERVRKLEKHKVITGYTTRVALHRLTNYVVVIAHCHVKQGREIRARFEQRMRGTPEVLECLEAAGSIDYIVKVVCKSIPAYQQLCDGWINDPSLHIERIESSVILRTAKDGGIYPVEIAHENYAAVSG